MEELARSNIFQTIPAHAVQHQEALDVGGLVEAPLPLLEAQVSLHAARHFQRTNRPHQQRNPAQCGGLLQRLGINLKQKITFGRTSLALVVHHHRNKTPKR